MKRATYLYNICVALCVLAVCAASWSCGDDEAPAVKEEPETLFDEDYWGTSQDTIVTGPALDVTYYSATLQGRMLLTPSKLAQFSAWGVVLATHDDPLPEEDERTVYSKRKTQLFTVDVGGLDMGTRYYYRAFLREGKGGRMQLGRVFYFTTQDCKTRTLPATDVTSFQATLHASTGLKLNDARFKGSFGFLYTARQTDRPSLEVDPMVQGVVAEQDSAGNFVGRLDDLTPGQTYIFQAYVEIDGNYYFSDNVERLSTAVLEVSDSKQPVDMGGSVGWASMNVGASQPQDPGGYYAWGDPTGLITTVTRSDLPTDYYSICESEYDIARVVSGGSWRMPTFEEAQELIDNCRWNWTTWQGTQGFIVHSDETGNNIFLPAQGYMSVSGPYGTTPTRKEMGRDQAHPCAVFWTGSLVQEMQDYAYYIYIGPERNPRKPQVNVRTITQYTGIQLYYCCSVRAVHPKLKK